MKRILALLLALAMLVLPSCAEEETLADMPLEDALYELVSGRLNEHYFGYDQPNYLAVSGLTAEEAAERHQSEFDTAVRRFASYFRIEYLTDELHAEIAALFNDYLYQYANYSAFYPAAKVDRDSYTVEVSVNSLNFISLVVDEIRAGALDDFTARFPTAVTGAMDEISYRQYDAMWAREILDLCYAQLENIGWIEDGSQTFTVHVEKADGVWTVDEAEYEPIFEAIIYYP